jgi:hypothetical protein
VSFSTLPTLLPEGLTGPLATLERDETRVLEYRLENGMRVLLVERHMDPVVAVMTWFGVGARNETEREAGVSHFLEHMMFKGSERFGKGQVDLLTTTLGGSNNAFTGADHTAYWFEFASDRWEKALELEAEARPVAADGREHAGNDRRAPDVGARERRARHLDPLHVVGEIGEHALGILAGRRRVVVGDDLAVAAHGGSSVARARRRRPAVLGRHRFRPVPCRADRRSSKPW